MKGWIGCVPILWSYESRILDELVKVRLNDCIVMNWGKSNRIDN